jgi:hypothetical protein
MKWKRNLKRLHEFKKKAEQDRQRAIDWQVRKEVVNIRRIAMLREPRLLRLPKDKLPLAIDRLARTRQEARRKKSK